jgi:ferredoxin
MDEETFKAKLKEFWRKGIAVYAPELRMVHNLPTFHFCMAGPEDIATPELLDLWKEFYEKDWHHTIPERWEKLKERGRPMRLRIMPAWKSVQNLPDLPAEQNLKKVIEGVTLASVMPCCCRHILRRCDAPLNNCLSFDVAAEDAISKGYARRISKEEAFDIAVSAETGKVGLVHLWFPMRGMFVFMCQCCSDCCHILNPGLESGKIAEVTEKSSFRPTIDPDLCNGCQDCVERCPFNAITMRSFPPSKKLKAVVEVEKCFGCGVCAAGCDVGAIIMSRAKS